MHHALLNTSSYLYSDYGHRLSSLYPQWSHDAWNSLAAHILPRNELMNEILLQPGLEICTIELTKMLIQVPIRRCKKKELEDQERILYNFETDFLKISEVLHKPL